MARGYGYVAADPFGGHSIGGEPPDTGDMTIMSGDKVTFRYRYLFHEGGPRAREHRRAICPLCRGDAASGRGPLVAEPGVWQDFLARLEALRAACGLAQHGAVVNELNGHGSPELSPLHAAAAGDGGSVQGRIGSLGAVLAD